MSQEVHDIIKIYDRLDKRGDIERIPVHTREDLAELDGNPAFRELLNDLHNEILEVDVDVHGHVEDGEMIKAARAGGMLAGLSYTLRWVLEMQRYFERREDPNYIEEED